MSAASKCRKTHPCDYRISKFSGGACPQTPLGSKALRALPILCPGVKLSCPPVENLNEPPGKKDGNLYGSNDHSETLSLERTEVFLCPIKAYLSNTPTNLFMVMLNFSLFCFVLHHYAFVQYCNVNTIQYNAMHKFVRVLDGPPFLSVVPLLLRVLEGHCFVSLLLEMLMPLR